MQASETVELTGHLLDSGLLSRIVDDIGEYGADFSFDSFEVGRRASDETRATITVSAADPQALARILMRLQTHGVNLVDPGEARTREVEHDGVFPEDFYSTTNLDTAVRLDGTWVAVEQPEMDCGLLVWNDGVRIRARTIPVSEVRHRTMGPAGMAFKGRLLPGRMSALSPESTVAPTARPSGQRM